MTKAIIFDCFGVILTDSLHEIRSELARRNPDAAQEVSDIVAANNRGLLQPEESNKRIATILGMEPEVFRRLVRSGEIRNERLLDLITMLKKEYKTALLSNIAGSSLARRFPDNELHTYFDVVAASADIGHAKPDREAYLYVAEKLGVRPDVCIFIDDRERFCQAAEAVGMRAILYTDFARFQDELQAYLAQDS